jgi:hypothetical protein
MTSVRHHFFFQIWLFLLHLKMPPACIPAFLSCKKLLEISRVAFISTILQPSSRTKVGLTELSRVFFSFMCQISINSFSREIEYYPLRWCSTNVLMVTTCSGLFIYNLGNCAHKLVRFLFVCNANISQWLTWSKTLVLMIKNRRHS